MRILINATDHDSYLWEAGYFSDEDTEETVKKNPEYASRLTDPESVQAICDVRSRPELASS